MKFTINWLKDFLDTSAPAHVSNDDIITKLTELGLEVDDVENKAEIYAPFKVAKVKSAEQHPDADRLRVCQVETDNGMVQVVCGAPNAKAGMTAIFAPVGSYIPGLDVTLEKGKIRGQESLGMLVSEREMQLSDEHNGIIELDDKYEIGTPITDIFDGLDDVMIEIGLTPDRADCAGIMGIARDLAAAGCGQFIMPERPTIDAKFKSTVNVHTDTPENCPHFMGRQIKGVKNGESPDWLKKKLEAIGLRSISILVDITNYFCIGMNRPLHVYDVNLLKAVTGRMHQVITDARYRFERGIDPQFTSYGIDLATQMILDLCGGEASEIVEAGAPIVWDKSFQFNTAQTEKLTGVKIDVQEQLYILGSLGFEVDGDENPYTVHAPTWRPDIMGTADLVEEIIRVYGYDKINATPVQNDKVLTENALSPIHSLRMNAGRTLGVRGMQECITWSFMPYDLAKSFNNEEFVKPSLKLTNPLSVEMDTMRPSILPNLIQACARNADRGYPNASLFEVGPTFHGVEADEQPIVCAGVRHGVQANKHWSSSNASRQFDAYDAKSDALAVIQSINPSLKPQIDRCWIRSVLAKYPNRKKGGIIKRRDKIKCIATNQS